MKVIFLGPPGAGKGTQAKIIEHKYNIPQISTGDMLRRVIKSGSALGDEVKAVLDSGALVPDDLITRLVKDRLELDDCGNGFLLDGYPRTLSQAESISEAKINIDYVILFNVPTEEIIKRISGRRIHPSSDRTYHLIYNPPKLDGVDDITGEPLIQRDDDKEDTVRHRLEVYHTQTSPLIDHYKEKASESNNFIKFIEVDGTNDVEVVSAYIFSQMK
ncbi:MAG: adenylate kinase [Francisellaceae bacterium]|jgi:adenylate kinase